MANRYIPLKQRFESNYIPEPNSGCWLWIGARIGTGYGATTIKDKTVGAHRVSWLLHHGPIPDGLLVCHRCDVPLCVNPDHLFLGTLADNSDDMIRKGRAVHPNGEAIPHARLTAEMVRACRSSSESNLALAERFGVSVATVKDAKQRRTWRGIR